MNSYADLNPDDYELFGPTLAANDQFIIAIQDRVGISFSAVFSYSTPSPYYCSVTYPSTNTSELYATMIAVARKGSTSISGNIFVFITYSINTLITDLVVASIDFSSCHLTIVSTSMIFNTTYPSYSVLGVNSNATMAIYLSDQNIHIQSLVSPYTNMKWSNITILFPYIQLIAVAIGLQDSWGILGAYERDSSSLYSQFTPTVYLINFQGCFTYMNTSCFNFTPVWQMPYSVNWQSFQVPGNNAAGFSYNSLYGMSISINDINNVLLGIQSMNTIFWFIANSTSLHYIGSRLPSLTPSIGFGKGVGWLDNTTAAILRNNFTIDYTEWRSSNIELYPLTTSSSLSSSISAYASFPNSHQLVWSQLDSHLINMLAVPETGSLIFMDYDGNVYVIRPSPAGYFAYTGGGNGQVNNTIYTAPSLPCSSGTIKNLSAIGKDLFRYCLLCAEGSFYSVNRSNQPNQCIPCNTSTEFCPWGAVAELPISVLDIISQTQVYPDTPENDHFEDLLLINMFNVDFSAGCLMKQPLFFALIIIGIGCLFLLFMGLLKLSGKFKKQRRMIKNIFKQTDLIREGELWIGGVASFAVIVIAVFAYRFSGGFLNQYPIETAGNATFSCDSTLRNAKFSTSMQSLGTPVLDEEQPLFDMLDNQPFTLNIAFINTDFSDKNLIVSQVLGTILVDLPRTTTQTDGILEISTNVTSHTTTITFNVSSNSACGGFRVGLTGPSITNENYIVQELNFSYAFNYSNRTTTQNPNIEIQLIKLINTTKPLSDGGENQYSALWIPTFIKNDDQLFYTESDFQLYHVLDNTVFTVQITEATYYIYNEQEPITKLTEVIFTDILFTTMCIELFGLTFLFYKLAISPIIKWITSLCAGPKKITPKGNGSGVGCPHCRSVDPDTLPSDRVPIQRAERDRPIYPIRRLTSDSVKLHTVSMSPSVFY